MSVFNRARLAGKMKRYMDRQCDERHGLQVDHQEARRLAERIEADPDDAEPAAALLRAERGQVLAQAMANRLTPQQRSVLFLRFGIMGRQPHTLEAVGRKIGLSRERVRQVEARAIRRLRQFEYRVLEDL
jgi:RNA polymerase primary sigma factor